MSDRRSLAGASLAAETYVSRGEESRLKAGCSQDWLPHIAASRKRRRGLSGITIAPGMPINNRPDPEGTSANLPHKIVAARDERNR